MKIELPLDFSSIPRLDDQEFELFRNMIYRETGINLKIIKEQMLSARLIRRLRALNLTSFSEYYEVLTSADPEGAELCEMINAVTTNKTAFFREPSHFVYLKSWLERRSGLQRRFRCWSAASSTGQEAYSMAITLHEVFGDRLPAYDVRILATDIDTQVLSMGREGIYRSSEIEDLAPERQQAYFLRGKGSQAGNAMVKPAVRQMVAFRRMNLNAPIWHVRGPFDIIFCRNVLIYFDEPTRYRLVERLRNLLRPGGLLFVGHAETLQASDLMLKSVGHAIYEVLS